MSEYNLILHKYCDEDGTYTVRGKLPGNISLDKINRGLERRGLQTVYVKTLKTVTVILKNETVHIRSNGAVTITGAAALKKAETAMKKLFPPHTYVRKRRK